MSIIGFAALAGFLACLPIANLLIQYVGSVCVPNGPCLISVWPEVMAPSGVLVIGAALVLRDAVHQTLGPRWALGAIAIGGVVSLFVAPPALALASAVAFLASELADFAVYAPLRKRRLTLAVLASGIVGATIDSALFLYLAFGSTNFLGGQLLGKLYATLIAAAVLAWLRNRRAFA